MNSPFAWPGGKKNLVQTILPLLPKHRIYVEPFCGSAKLLFAKEPSTREIISDADGELINFFRVAKHRPSALAQEFHTALCHPTYFRQLKHTRPGDEVDRAFRFLYLTYFSFGAKAQHFAGHRDFLPNKRLDLIAAKLEATAERLRNVVIECGNYAEIIRKYDSAKALFYCDPPYYAFGSNGRYKPFTGKDLDELFETLARVKGKFLLSEQSHAEVAKRVRQHEFNSRRVHTRYSLAARNNWLKAPEVLISNYTV